MRAVDIIIKKRDKNELTSQEIEFFVQGFTKGDIPDYQAASFAMTVLLNGMTPFETADLTLAMARSGQVLDLSKVVDIAVDKHSSAVWVIRPASRSCRWSRRVDCQSVKCQAADLVSAAAHWINWNPFRVIAWI